MALLSKEHTSVMPAQRELYTSKVEQRKMSTAVSMTEEATDYTGGQ